MNFRQPDKKDKPNIKDVLDASFDRTYAFYANKSFSSLENALIAEEKERLTGVVNWRLLQSGEEKLGYIFWLAVHPDFQRKGIAQELVNKAIKAIYEAIGPCPVYAAVENDNNASASLMLKSGFERISRDEMQKHYGLDAHRLFFQMRFMPHEELFVLKPGVRS